MHYTTYNSRFGGGVILSSLTFVDYALVGTLLYGYSSLMSLPCLFFEKCPTRGSWRFRECNENHFVKCFCESTLVIVV